MTDYPHVFGEHETLAFVHAGLSLARFGDGEFSLCAGGSQVREPANRVLAQELRFIVSHPLPRLLVGIPTMDPGSPKHENWLKRKDRICQFVRSDIHYGSAFVTRPDSAAEDLRTDAYCHRVVDLWRHKRTVLVAERDSAIYALVACSIASSFLEWVACPHRETYAVLETIERQVIDAEPEIVLVSCGPAATCLVHRLTKKGYHAVDIGSAGSFILKQLYHREIPMSGKVSHMPT